MTSFSSIRNSRHPFAFTILELLVAMVVLTLISVMAFTIISHTGDAVRLSNERVESFKTARQAFETLTRQLSQATLNTYYDYFDSSRKSRSEITSGAFLPDLYGRQSDLHFVSGNSADNRTLVPGQIGHAVFFQAPIGFSDGTNTDYSGLENALNACGFFVTYASDEEDLPQALRSQSGNSRHRFRLYRWLQPTDKLTVYNDSSQPYQWFDTPLSHPIGSTSAHHAGVFPLADNVLALIILPKLPATEDPTGNQLAPNFNYDSRISWSGNSQPPQMNQIPPLLEVVMLTIDETSANRFLKNITTIDNAFEALGVDLNGKFTSAEQLETDITTTENALSAKGVNFHTFRTTIPLRSSKWSGESQP